MAEDSTTDTGGRQILITATVITVVFFVFLMMTLQSCSNLPASQQDQTKLPSHVVIYSNMDLKDSASVITRLKELKIPYQVKDEGRAVAVPRGRADDARLGLAEKGLPLGGTVGWEIFDQTKLGATDFDRRIQFIRAVSGELSRTITRIRSIEEARVQLVIPETQLFEVKKAPVTASVLIKFKPGELLTKGQVSGIVHLVAGSVENLKTENVTIIDTGGNILTGSGYSQLPEEEISPAPDEVIVEKEEGKQALEVQAKLDLEERLTSKVQSLLNRMYPPNVTISRVNVDSLGTKRITVILLVDKKYKLSSALKKATYETVSAAIGYDKERGDKILLKSVTFHAAGPVSSTEKIETKIGGLSLTTLKQIYRRLGKQSAIAIVVLFVFFLLMVIALLRGGGKAAPVAEAPEMPETGAVPPVGEAPPNEEEVPVVEQMKTLAAQNPQLVAKLIKTWLAGGG